MWIGRSKPIFVVCYVLLNVALISIRGAQRPPLPHTEMYRDSVVLHSLNCCLLAARLLVAQSSILSVVFSFLFLLFAFRVCFRVSSMTLLLGSLFLCVDLLSMYDSFRLYSCIICVYCWVCDMWYIVAVCYSSRQFEDRKEVFFRLYLVYRINIIQLYSMSVLFYIQSHIKPTPCQYVKHTFSIGMHLISRSTKGTAACIWYVGFLKNENWGADAKLAARTRLTCETNLAAPRAQFAFKPKTEKSRTI